MIPLWDLHVTMPRYDIITLQLHNTLHYSGIFFTVMSIY